MNSKLYFSQLRHEFQNDPYRDRFLAELEDHAEDLAESENRSSKSLNLNFMHKHFGDPKQVKKDFVNITRPWQKVLEAGEALGYGALKILLLMLMPAFLAFVSRPLSLSFFQNNFFQGTVLIFSFFLLYFLLWRFVIPRKYDFLTKKSLLGFSVIPQILLLFFLVWSIYRRWSLFGEADGLTSYAVLTVFSILIDLAAFYFVSKKNQPINLSQIPYQWKLYQAFGFVFFAYILVYSAFRFALPMFNFEPYKSFKEAQWWEILFQPIYYAEKMLLNQLPSAFSVATPWVHYFQIFLVMGLLIWSLGYFLLQKRFSWFATAIGLYALGLLFVPQKGWLESEPDFMGPLKFAVPAVDVSQQIEKRQSGPFYNMVHHLEQRYFSGLVYQVDLGPENHFMLQSLTHVINGSQDYLFYPKFIPGTLFQFDSEDQSVVRLKSATFSVDSQPFNEEKWNEAGLSCKNNYGGTVRSSKFPFYPICEQLFFKNQLLMKAKNGQFLVYDFAFSSKKDSLLLSLDYAPESQKVYWLDLK